MPALIYHPRSAAGESEIQDELSEAITLNNVTCMVGEWGARVVRLSTFTSLPLED